MADLRPFKAYRPTPELAERVASPPYDVLNSAEAREMAAGNPHSFLHVVKPEIDLPEGTDLYSAEVYAKGAENLKRLISEGALIQEAAPAFYAYQQRMGDHVQVGLVAGASVAEYDQGLIKKHEKTRAAKEDDRTRHVDALDANTGPVFLTYQKRPEIDALIEEVRSGKPEYDFVSPDGIGHTLWVIDDEKVVEKLQARFKEVEVLYVADGHHRSASASRVAAARKAANAAHSGEEAYNYFLTVIFPDDQMKILDYNRVVFDLNGHSVEGLLEKISERFEIVPTDEPAPPKAQQFGMFLDGSWRRLIAKAGTFPEGDPVRSLDVSILQENLLQPLLGIEDPRTSNRIDFVGGIRGMKELERRVNEGAAIAFSLYPTSISQLIAIADAGAIMPPKSTWFEPKLRSGLLIRPLSEAK